jgi:hypothetical protein
MGAGHGVPHAHGPAVSHGPTVPHATIPHAQIPGMPQRPGIAGGIAPRAAAPPKPADDRIELVDEPSPVLKPNGTAAEPVKHVPRYDAQDMNRREEVFKRPLHTTPTGATRVRSFHGRLSDQGLEYMDHAINEWLDRHPDVDVKFVTSVTGVYEGKIREPAVILNIWY